ncbi:MAG: PDGLE domain-containing protein [Calditrichia bacterium]
MRKLSSVRLGWIIFGIFIILLLLTIFSSSLPDGLESVAGKLGILHHDNPQHAAPLADYTVSSQLPSGLNQILSGLIGAGLLSGIIYLIYHFRNRGPQKRRRKS